MRRAAAVLQRAAAVLQKAAAVLRTAAVERRSAAVERSVAEVERSAASVERRGAEQCRFPRLLSAQLRPLNVRVPWYSDNVPQPSALMGISNSVRPLSALLRPLSALLWLLSALLRPLSALLASACGKLPEHRQTPTLSSRSEAEKLCGEQPRKATLFGSSPLYCGRSPFYFGHTSSSITAAPLHCSRSLYCSRSLQ